MEKAISFISSNSRNLYVEDIYRALALPKKYILQYRYQLKHIDNDILIDINSLKGAAGVIFYSYHPDNEYVGTVGEKCLAKVILPIRKVIIRDIDINNEVGQVNFFLELCEFINTEIDFMEISLKETNVFDLNIEHTREVSWLEKIEVIKDYFKADICFFYIKNILGNKISIVYNYDEKRTNIELTDESSYIIEFLTYDKSEGKGNIQIIPQESYINLNDTLEKGTKTNSKKITIDTRPIDFRTNRTFLDIKDEKSGFIVKIFITLRKQFKRSLTFGVLSTIALFGFQVSNLLIKDAVNTTNLGILLLIAVPVALGIAGLHWGYNKK